jgi:hypothetical protein
MAKLKKEYKACAVSQGGCNIVFWGYPKDTLCPACKAQKKAGLGRFKKEEEPTKRRMLFG